MADCMMVGRCVGVRNYKKKDNSDGVKVSIADSHGSILEFFGNHALTEFPFGTPVTVVFDINVFNGRPSGLVIDELKEVKEK